MTRQTRDWLVRGTVVAALAVVVVLGWRSQRGGPIVAGSRAPEFRAESLAGDTISLASLRGHVVLLNAWATWCAPCREEMPALEKLYRELGPKGLRVVAVSEDAAPAGVEAAASRRDVASFARELGLTFPVLLDPSGRLQEGWGIIGLPTTYLIGRDGRVVRRLLGPKQWDAPPYSTELRSLLEG